MPKKIDNQGVPTLRFAGFEDDWEEKTLGDVYSFKRSFVFTRDQLNYTNGQIKNIHYGDIHTKYSLLFDITKEIVPYINEVIRFSREIQDMYCMEGDVIFADASENLNDIGKCIEIINIDKKKLVAGLHTLLARPLKNNISLGFSAYLFNSLFMRKQIQKISQGTKVLGISASRMLALCIILPKTLPEQQKIATCLKTLDEKIEAETERLEALKAHKSGLMQRLFPTAGETVPKLRFEGFSDDWEEKTLGDVLEYERPDPYFVRSTNYISNGTPVLTANKSFILGYTNEIEGICLRIPAIIFDDFTVDNKYVNFNFKVKSSAIKILRPKYLDDLIFIYSLIQTIKFEATEHKRYYISVYQKICVSLPTLPEQQKIAICLSALDERINVQTEMIETLKLFKKGLMQGLFPATA